MENYRFIYGILLLIAFIWALMYLIPLVYNGMSVLRILAIYISVDVIGEVIKNIIKSNEGEEDTHD